MTPAVPKGNSTSTQVLQTAGNIAGADFVAKAKALAKLDADGAAELAEAVMLSGVSEGFFKPIADAIAESTGLTRKTYFDMMRSGRVDAGKLASQGTRGLPMDPSRNPDPVPNPEPLNRLLDFIVSVIQRQIVCSPHAAWAIALWIAGTFGFRGCPIFPRLVFTSPTKRCGKSTALGTVETLCSAPEKTDNISAAAMFRRIESRRPTLLVDEVDAFFNSKEELRNVVNAGYQHAGKVTRAISTPDGKGWTDQDFNVYCPVALAGIGGLPETVLDRSVIIRLERAPARGASQRKRALRYRDLEKLRVQIVPHLVAHASAIETAMANGVKVLPASLGDRAQDKWEPLLAIADLAGGQWPQRARDAAQMLSGSADAESQREMLLADLKQFITAERAAAVAAWQNWMRGGRKGWKAWVQGGCKGPCPSPSIARYIRSTEALRHLLEMEHRPWPEFGKDGKGLTPHRLADMLKPFGVKPVQRRMPTRQAHSLNTTGTEVVRAYSISALRHVFRRYVP